MCLSGAFLAGRWARRLHAAWGSGQHNHGIVGMALHLESWEWVPTTILIWGANQCYLLGWHLWNTHRSNLQPSARIANIRTWLSSTFKAYAISCSHTITKQQPLCISPPVMYRWQSLCSAVYFNLLPCNLICYLIFLLLFALTYLLIYMPCHLKNVCGNTTQSLKQCKININGNRTI